MKVVFIVGKALFTGPDTICTAVVPIYSVWKTAISWVSQSVYLSTRSMQQAGYQIKVLVLLQTILPLRFVHWLQKKLTPGAVNLQQVCTKQNTLLYMTGHDYHGRVFLRSLLNILFCGNVECRIISSVVALKKSLRSDLFTLVYLSFFRKFHWKYMKLR